MSTRKLQITLLILLAATLISTAAYGYVGQGRQKDENTGADTKAAVREEVEENTKEAIAKIEGSNLQTNTNSNDDEGSESSKQVADDENNNDAAGRQAQATAKTNIRDNSGSSNGSNVSNKSLAQILAEKNIPNPVPDLKIVVDKTDNVLTLYSGSVALKSYHAAIGEGGLGDKERSGDHKTPEGTFYISEKLVLSPADKILGTRWMRVSYPNLEDAERGLQTGLIDQATYDQITQANRNGTTPPQKTSLGGGVGIHGGSGYPDNQGDYWTWGCVGLTDKDVEEIYEYIQVGTPLIIQK